MDTERLTPYRERVVRTWPSERIKPATVARCLDSVLAELDTLRAERERLVAAIEEAGALIDFQANLGHPDSRDALRQVVSRLTAVLDASRSAPAAPSAASDA